MFQGDEASEKKMNMENHVCSKKYTDEEIFEKFWQQSGAYIRGRERKKTLYVRVFFINCKHQLGGKIQVETLHSN